jgi:hypothetical protein
MRTLFSAVPAHRHVLPMMPLVAAELGVPWARHSLGTELPASSPRRPQPPRASSVRLAGLYRAERVAYLDICPVALQARVLPLADAVVCVGGMGTILAVAASSVPFVSMPRFPSQGWITKRAAELGAGIVIDGPEGVPGAVALMLSDDRYRRGAAASAATLAEMAEPGEALAKLLALVQ